MNIADIVLEIGAGGVLGQAAGQVGLEPGQAKDALHGVIEHMVSGGQITEIADAVGARVGLSPDQIHAFLPIALSLLQGHAQGAGGGVQDALGGVMGPLGGLLSGAAPGGQPSQTSGLGAIMGDLLGGQPNA